MNLFCAIEGWKQYYSVTITRRDGRTETFNGLEAHKVVELVSLCLTVDDPHTTLIIQPIKPNTIMH